MLLRNPLLDWVANKLGSRIADRGLLVTIFATAVALAVYGFAVKIFWPSPLAGKLLGSSGLILTVAGVLQLEVSGLFDDIIEQYANSQQSPPSSVVREIIDNPDTPIRTAARNWLFFNRTTGIRFVVWGTLIQVAAIWV